MPGVLVGVGRVALDDCPRGAGAHIDAGGGALCRVNVVVGDVAGDRRAGARLHADSVESVGVDRVRRHDRILARCDADADGAVAGARRPRDAGPDRAVRGDPVARGLLRVDRRDDDIGRVLDADPDPVLPHGGEPVDDDGVRTPELEPVASCRCRDRSRCSRVRAADIDVEQRGRGVVEEGAGGRAGGAGGDREPAAVAQDLGHRRGRGHEVCARHWSPSTSTGTRWTGPSCR